MIYRCLVHKPSAKYCGQIVGSLDDWSGIASSRDAWAIVEKELNPQSIDCLIELGFGCNVLASVIDAGLVIGGDV